MSQSAKCKGLLLTWTEELCLQQGGSLSSVLVIQELCQRDTLLQLLASEPNDMLTTSCREVKHGAGVLRNMTAGDQPVDRCFFWMQAPRAHAPSTGAAKQNLQERAIEEPGLSAGPVRQSGSAGSSVEAPQGILRHEGRPFQCMSATQAAHLLHELVQSAASRAPRRALSSPAPPVLQNSGEPPMGYALPRLLSRIPSLKCTGHASHRLPLCAADGRSLVRGSRRWH